MLLAGTSFVEIHAEARHASLEPKRLPTGGVPDDASCAPHARLDGGANVNQTGHGREDDCPSSPVRSNDPARGAGREDLGEARPSIAVHARAKVEVLARRRGLDLFHHQVVVQVRDKSFDDLSRDDDQGAVAIDHEDGIGEDAAASRDDETVASFPVGPIDQVAGDEAIQHEIRSLPSRPGSQAPGFARPEPRDEAASI